MEFNALIQSISGSLFKNVTTLISHVAIKMGLAFCLLLSSNVFAIQCNNMGETPSETFDILENSSQYKEFWNARLYLEYRDDPKIDNGYARLHYVNVTVCTLSGTRVNYKDLPTADSRPGNIKIDSTLLTGSHSSYIIQYRYSYTIGALDQWDKMWEKTFTQSAIKRVNVYKNQNPSVELSTSTISVNLGETAEVTVTAKDNEGKLDGDLTLTVPSDWEVSRQPCASTTEFKHECLYKITPPNKASSLGTKDFMAKVLDKMNLPASKSGTITVSETNKVPEFTQAKISKTTIGIDQSVTLTAKAKDSNVDPAKRLNGIKWCYSESDSTAQCKEIVKSTPKGEKCYVSDDLSTASCEYTKTFTNSGVYTLWAVASDPHSTVKSDKKTLTVDAPPVVTFTTSGRFSLGSKVNFTATAVDDNLKYLKLCYVKEGQGKTTCPNEIKLCDPNASQQTVCEEKNFLLDPDDFEITQYDFYALASDGINPAVHQSSIENIIGSYTVSVPDVTASSNVPGVMANVSGTYHKLNADNIAISSIVLYVNDVQQQIITDVNSSTVFAFDYALPSITQPIFEFKLIDSEGVAVWSQPFTYTVDLTHPPIVAPIVSHNAGSTNTDGRIALTATPVGNATQYEWYKYQTCPTNEQEGNSLGSTLNPSHTVIKNYEDNGQYCYCAQAKNSNGPGPIGFGNACAQVTLEVPDYVPGLTRFSPNLSLSQNSSYQLEWLNTNKGARSFKVERQLGHADTSQAWQTLYVGANTQLLISTITVPNVSVAGLEAGDVSYRVTACNSDNVCEAGQIITVNHQVPYLHEAEFVEAASSANFEVNQAEIIFEGLGLQGIDTANIQLRNTGETVTLAVYQQAGDGHSRYRLRPTPRVIKGLDNGGLRLQVSTLIGSATIEFNTQGSSDRANIDLINKR
ncbi:hypothetical protein [Shewanella surugensis]|uniref:Ig-like domain-containing protein n=1 Tax=Shewanella surugensis TaxID=212020 RepID=A0ABT0LF18_9GAMM|nr:hypothetical protein [Shewanella surugensis]MCL1126302.1 hypothetical protein [Shewanella surugensis]